jgi:putative tryptophan/tyrosine transport system substrate-binding protein
MVARDCATATIPIAFVAGFDPVEVGLVSSLNRPGGNLTGVSNLNVELGSKQLELLHELVPTATIIALLVNQTNRKLTETTTSDAQADVCSWARTRSCRHALPRSGDWGKAALT